MTVKEMTVKIQHVQKNLIPWCEEIIEAHAADIKELLRDQMYAGLDGEGNKLTPGYSQDPYFKKPGAGDRYAKWKDTLILRNHNSIFPAKGFDTPNLIITGTLIYDRIFVQVGNGKLILDATSSIIAKIKLKYGDIFKLSPLALMFFTTEILRPKLTARITSYMEQ